MDGKKEVRGVGEGECGQEPRVSLGRSATLSKVMFPRPCFDLDVFVLVWRRVKGLFVHPKNADGEIESWKLPFRITSFALEN